MTSYRYYCLDGAGRIQDAHWFDAPDDEQALTMIQSLHPDSSCEIWKGNQLIGSTKRDQEQQRA